jgi:hypothetical protein
MDRRTDDRLQALARQIARWRRTRARRTRMPELLWQEAAALAEQLGLSKVASTLGLGYYSLQQRLPSTSPASAGFVELSGSQLLTLTPSATSETVVDLRRADGAHLTLRLVPGSQLDVTAVVQAFLAPRP